LQREGSPLRVVGADDLTEYVIISSEQFERLRALFDQGSLSHTEQGELLRAAGKRAGWDDPEMDAYDNFDSHRTTP
ncbi:MAG: hypothetical protein ACK5Q5_10195, partial [Planctomycetaceae bacterium]